MQNIFIQKNIQLVSGGTPTAKTVEIDTKSVTEGGKKKLVSVIPTLTVKSSTNPDKWGDGLPVIPKMPELLMIEDDIKIKGELKTDEESRALLNMASGLGGTSSDTAITIDNVRSLDTVGTLKPSYIQIDDEVMEYTAATSTTITVSKRGFGGTTITTHSNDAKIFHPAYHYKKLLQYIIREGGVCSVFFASGSAVYATTNNPPTSGTVSSMDGSFANMPQFSGQITQWSFADVPEDANALTNTIGVDLTIQIGVNL